MHRALGMEQMHISMKLLLSYHDIISIKFSITWKQTCTVQGNGVSGQIKTTTTNTKVIKIKHKK